MTAIVNNVKAWADATGQEINRVVSEHVAPKVQKVYDFVVAKLQQLYAFLQPHIEAAKIKCTQIKDNIVEIAKKCKEAFIQFAQYSYAKGKEFSEYAIAKALVLKAYIERTFEVELSAVAQKAGSVAIKIAKVAAAAILFLSNSSVFVLGAIVGFAAKNKMKEILDSGTRVWTDLAPHEKAAAVAAGLIAWPITLAMGAFFTGAAASVHLQERYQNRQNQPQVQPLQEVVIEQV